MRKAQLAVLAITIMLVGCLTGCGSTRIENVPPGYVGKILTPTGWKTGIYDSGQVDIGVEDSQGRSNQLVNCEATTVTIKETFGKSGTEKDQEDHRIITQKRVPLAVDVYVQVGIPTDEKMRDSIFAQVTPVPDKNDGHVSWITLQQIYDQFATMTIRGKTREIFAGYKDYDDVMNHYGEVSKKVSAMIIDTFKDTKTPLRLLGGQLSNVKEDETVWAAENKRAAAAAEVDTINQVGKAIQQNPGFLEKYKWDQLEKLANKGVTVIVNDGGGSNRVGYNIQPTPSGK